MKQSLNEKMRNEIVDRISKGGEWLRAAREYIKNNIKEGDRIYWSSQQPVNVPFNRLSELAEIVAHAAIIEEETRKLNEEIIVEYNIPIKNYEGNDIFNQTLFVKCNHGSPNREEIVSLLKKLIEKNEKFFEENLNAGPNLKTWEQCLDTVTNIPENDFPRVYKHGLVQTNCFVYTEFGRQSFGIRIIDINTIS